MTQLPYYSAPKGATCTMCGTLRGHDHKTACIIGEAENLKFEVSRLTEERDALAAQVEEAWDFIESNAHQYDNEGQAFFNQWVEDHKNDVPAAILASRDAAQRKAGTLWALYSILNKDPGKKIIYVPRENIDKTIDAIKRGEVTP